MKERTGIARASVSELSDSHLNQIRERIPRDEYIEYLSTIISSMRSDLNQIHQEAKERLMQTERQLLEFEELITSSSINNMSLKESR